MTKPIAHHRSCEQPPAEHRSKVSNELEGVHIREKSNNLMLLVLVPSRKNLDPFDDRSVYLFCLSMCFDVCSCVRVCARANVNLRVHTCMFAPVFVCVCVC